jgi:hypothetical protein
MLFGRAEHLALAGRALDAARAGRGGALVVTGEAGIGKSALVRALAGEAEARGARVGFGRTWEVGGAPAYWPWSQALAELGLDLDELLGNASAEMASAQRVVAFDRIVRAVCPAEGAPVVLILDDLHAADVASVELALVFVRAALRKRALLVVTTRESELLERREVGELVGKLGREGSSIPLRRLDAAATASWLRSVGFDGDAAEVHRLSEGNPLFIEEAVRLGVDRFASAAAGGVAVVLAEHLSRISDQTRDILSVASVLGREAEHADIAALGGHSRAEVEAAAREGQVAGVLSAGTRGTLVFSHVLLRDALYETLAVSRSEPLHARAADLIEARGGPAALVARHLLDAGRLADADRVAHSVCRAAEAEVARHAADSAALMLANARARLAGRLDEPTALLLDLGEVDALMRAAPSDHARTRAADCAARAKRAGLFGEHARAALVYGGELLTGRVDARMVNLLEEALVSLPHAERWLRAQILARLSSALIPARSDETFAQSIAYGRAAIATARETAHVPTLLQTLRWSVHGLVYGVPLEERVELTSELVSLAREHGAELVLADVGGVHAVSLLDSGRPVAARHEAEAYCRLVESLPLPALRWKATALSATLALIDGRLDDARRFTDEVRRAAFAAQHPGRWAICELALCASTNDPERLREFEPELTAALAAPALRPWLSCAEAMLGRPGVERSLLASAPEHARGDRPCSMLRRLPHSSGARRSPTHFTSPCCARRRPVASSLPAPALPSGRCRACSASFRCSAAT